ncbi:DUF6444 domain-containing protein [Streptomyces sp. NPDC006283]|uniref:DUF6444 domain-containing protein n=1 Tax=Streptomyces sp. NPDC006283 TaxID=3156741 RepID=UPI00339DC99F
MCWTTWSPPVDGAGGGERRLGRNSGNSSRPPSTDTFGRPENKPRLKSDCKRGVSPVSTAVGCPRSEARCHIGPYSGGL